MAPGIAPVGLPMHSFDWRFVMKHVKKIVAAVAVAALILGELHLCNYLFNDDTASYTRLMMHEFYNQDSIDIMLVGASHVYRGLNPEILTEQTGRNVFCASSSSQFPDGSLAMVKEAIKKYNPEKIYLELSYSVAKGTGIYKDRTDMTSTYLLSDYMKPSINKYTYLLQASSSAYYMNALFPARRRRNKFMDWDYLSELLDKKSTTAYREYGYDYATHDDEWYVGKGYVASSKAVADSTFEYESVDGFNQYDADKISDDWKESVSSIIKVCQENNVSLTIYVAPISNFQLTVYGNYDEYIDFVETFLEGTGVDFVDFNLLKNEYFPFEAGNFQDGNHLNMYGAEKFSEIFADFINGELPESAFENTVSEKLDAQEAVYYGITYTKGEEDKEIHLIANHPEQLEYEISVASEDGEERLIQEFDSNDEFFLPKGEKGTLIVKYRRVDNPDQVVISEREF
jgi:hypothetical protein